LICKKCGGEGPFYVSDPHHCQKCIKARVKAHRQANVERIRADDQRRANLPHRVAARAAYQATGAPAINRSKAAWIHRNPIKRWAHNVLNRAVKDGKIMKPEACSKCGREVRIEGHHPDYSKPLEVIWLCHRCHIAEH
jgi:hypothetical protein